MGGSGGTERALQTLMCKDAAVRLVLKSGVLVALASLAVAVPAFAQTETEQPTSGGGGFTIKYRWVPQVSYGQRATISGSISEGGWKITLFLRAAGESRFHAAGSVKLGSGGHKFSLRTGKLARTTRFRLAYTKGKTHAQGGVSTIGVLAKVTTGAYSYAADGSLHFRVTVAPNQPSGARVRIFGVDAAGVRREVATVGLLRSGAMSVADATVPNPASYTGIEASFLGSSSNRAVAAFFTPPAR
jgi:hypothetical protein